MKTVQQNGPDVYVDQNLTGMMTTNYTVKTQPDSPSNVENNRHPIPSDWSIKEDFWNGKAFEKSPFTQCKYQDISNKNDSARNDNLYPQSYRAKS